jgi:hypothetical protein
MDANANDNLNNSQLNNKQLQSEASSSIEDKSVGIGHDNKSILNEIQPLFIDRIMKNGCKNCRKLQRKLKRHEKQEATFFSEDNASKIDTNSFIRVILIERRLLVKLAEMSFKKLIKYQ